MKGYSKIKSRQNREPRELFPSQPASPRNDYHSADESDEKGSSDKLHLRRNFSVSTVPTSRQGSSLSRNVSMRRSTSVTDRYRRINDQIAVLPVGGDDDAQGTDSCDGSVMKEKKVGRGGKRLLKACKRIFRL